MVDHSERVDISLGLSRLLHPGEVEPNILSRADRARANDVVPI